jgi:hypothetical protein
MMAVIENEIAALQVILSLRQAKHVKEFTATSVTFNDGTRIWLDQGPLGGFILTRSVPS